MTRNVYGVIGANYGDEGKGRTVDAICRLHDGTKIVICTNGSSQRGHTVVYDNVRHVFHHFGSGTIAGADTYFAKEFIVNPFMYEQEEKELKEKDIIIPMCFVNEECKVATVYDMLANQIIELTRSNKHGSCGCGVWDTIVRYQGGPNSTIGTLAKLSNTELLNYLTDCRAFCKERTLSVLEEENLSLDVFDEYKSLFEDENLLMANAMSIDHFLNSVRLVHNSSFLSKYETVVFENGQGLLLDYRVDKKLSTPSITGSEVIANVFKDNFPVSENTRVKLYYVTRTYITRHGNANFKEKCDISEINPNIVDETNQPHPFQGSLMFGRLNIEELYERVQKDATMVGVDADFGLSVTHTTDFPWQYKEKPIGNLWMEFD